MPENTPPLADALRLPAPDRTGLGKALAAERQAQGITQRQMEAATTVPQGRISRIERGTAHAALWEIAAIGAVLGLDAEIVITRRERSPSSFAKDDSAIAGPARRTPS